MFSAERTYALDIESDTSGGGGLDPAFARITEIAVASPAHVSITANPLWRSGDGQVFGGDDETLLLANHDHYIRSLPPGLIATWNGAFFDLPYIELRSIREDVRKPAEVGLNLGMHLIVQPGLTPKYSLMPGAGNTGYTATWASSSPLSRDVHTHLDVSFAYKQVAADLGVKWSLKPVCRALGISMFDATGKPYEDPESPGEVDRTQVHLMPADDRRDYALSDARGTRELALLLLGA